MTTESLDDRIRALKGRLASQSRLKRRLEQADLQLSKRRSTLRIAEATLDRENADVARLEGLTMTALFHTMLFSKKEQLDQERQEALRAELARDECSAAVQRLESDLGRMGEELKELGYVQGDLAKALDEKDDLLRGAGGMKSRRLFELGDERAATSAELAQVQEARAAGDFALDSLQSVIDSLDAASGWGNWDLMGGGAMVATIKHSHIDSSRESAHEAQADLLAFGREVEDLDFSGEIDLEVSSFNKFADFFFDGLISDWIVQSKIRRSRDATVEVLSRVQVALKALDQRAATLEGQVAKLEAERLLLLGA